MKKKLLALALVLAMALTLMPTMAFAEALANHDSNCTATADDVEYTHTAQVDATCGAAGVKEYWTCKTCNTNFSDANGSNAISNLDTWKADENGGKIAINSSAHPDASLSYTKDENGHTQHCSTCNQDVGSQTAHAGDWTTTATQHSKTCSTCGYEMVAAANHDENGSNGACSICGYTAGACTNATTEGSCTATTHNKGCIEACTKSDSCDATGTHKTGCPKASADPAPAVTIVEGSVSAQYDGATLTVTWTLSGTLDTAATFEVKVDSDAITDKDAFTFTTDAMGQASADCSFTTQTSIPDGTHEVIVSSDAVSGDGRTEITVSTASSEPSQPSDGIPNPGSVTTPAAAESAIKDIQSADADKIAAEIEKELADTSASTETIDQLEKLEAAVMDQAGISVVVAPDSKVPDALNTKKVSIVGAALNAEKTSNTKIELQISAPKTERTLGRTYDNDAAVQFSMTLTNVVSTKKLAVPVVITLPLPSGISASRAVVLHYSGSDGASQVLQSKVSGSSISFVVTGFSDFIITQRAERKTSSGGGGGGTTATNIPVTVTPTVPSTPAAIFTDVPASHSFASQITWARDNGVMGGYSDGSFRPANPTNRQQLWMVLARLSGAAPADMAAAREWAVNSGVSDGANGEGTLSRQQLVTMLYRYAQSQEMNLEGAADLAAYPDNAAVASYAREALAWAVGKGIVTGTSDGRLNPEGTATRGQFAVIMYRFSHQG